MEAPTKPREGSVLFEQWTVFEDLLARFPALQHLVAVPFLVILSHLVGPWTTLVAVCGSTFFFYHLRLLRSREEFFASFHREPDQLASRRKVSRGNTVVARDATAPASAPVTRRKGSLSLPRPSPAASGKSEASPASHEAGKRTSLSQQMGVELSRKETCQWLNSALERYWADSFVPEYDFNLREQLQVSLDSVSKPAYCRSVQVVNVSLGGHASPRIRSMRTVKRPASPDEFVSVCSIEWASALKILLRVQLQLGKGGRGFGSISSLQVGISDLSFRGTARLSISFVKKVCDVSFLELPNFDFAVRPLNSLVDLASVPGLSEWLRQLTQAQLAEWMVWPQKWPLSLWGDDSKRVEISRLSDVAQRRPTSAERKEEFDCSPSPAADARPITDCTLLFTEREKQIGSNFSVVDKTIVAGYAANINSGVEGGSPVYLAIERGGTQAPITALRVLVRNENDRTFQVPDGFEIVGKNLNQGARDCRTEAFLCVKRSNDPPITDIGVLFADVEEIPKNYQKLDVNLNYGTVGLRGASHGRPVFFCFRRQESTKADTTIAKQEIKEAALEFEDLEESRSQEPIEELAVSYDDEPPPEGFTSISHTSDHNHVANLNAGNLGRRVWLCFKRKTSRSEKMPITNIDVVSSLERIADGFEPVERTLNKGAPGLSLFFVALRHKKRRPLTDLAVIRGNDPVPRGFRKIDVSLNRGSPSPISVFLCYKRAKAAPTQRGMVVKADEEDSASVESGFSPEIGEDKT